MINDYRLNNLINLADRIRFVGGSMLPASIDDLVISETIDSSDAEVVWLYWLMMQIWNEP